MIGKIQQNNSFRETTRYVLGKENVQILDGTIAATETDTISREFLMSRDLNPDIQRPVYHLIQSYAYEDRDSQTLTNPKLVELSMKHFAGVVISAYDHQLLDEKDLSPYQTRVDEFIDNQMYEYQFFIAKHQDTDHVHTHLVASRINLLDGRAIPTYLERIRSQKICRLLEKEFGLRQLENSWQVDKRKPSPMQKEKEAVTGAISVQEKLQDTIEQVAQTSKSLSFEQFTQTLKARGVELKLHPRGHQIGLSYAMDGVAMRASKLGRNYSYSGLQKKFGVRVESITEPERRPTAISSRPESDPLEQVLQTQTEYANRIAPVLQAIWKREQSNTPEQTVIDLKAYQIQRDDDTHLRLYKRQRLILEWRNGRYQGYGLTHEDYTEIEQFNQISERQAKTQRTPQPDSRHTDPPAQRRTQSDEHPTAIRVESDIPKIESATPETESAVEMPQPVSHQSEAASAVEREDKEAERRRERYRQRYEHYSSGFKVTPQQKDLIVLRRALSDGCEPVTALNIVGQGETAQGIKNDQGQEAAIDYLNQLYATERRRLELEQEQRQSRDLEWER